MFTKPLKWILNGPQYTLPCVAGVDELTDILKENCSVFRLTPEWNWYGCDRCFSNAYIIIGNASLSPVASVTRSPRLAQVVLPSPQGQLSM